jgi:hypothetical protein
MSRLAHQQRAVLALLKSRSFDLSGDDWLKRISQSKELVMLREIARWWRQYQVTAQCRFTALLLKRTGRFEESVNQFFEESATSPFIEEMARGFLKTLSTRGEPLVREVAQTELGLMDVRQDRRTEVDWDRHPDMVFAALETGAELPERDEEYEYHLVIGRTLQCVRRRRVNLNA